MWFMVVNDFLEDITHHNYCRIEQASKQRAIKGVEDEDENGEKCQHNEDFSMLPSRNDFFPLQAIIFLVTGSCFWCDPCRDDGSLLAQRGAMERYGIASLRRVL